MPTVDNRFLTSFYSCFEKSTSAITRRADLETVQNTVKKELEHSGTVVVSSAFATCESDAGTFLMVLDDAGLHILNTHTHSHTILDRLGNFHSKIGTLLVPVSVSILEKSFFDWIALHGKSLRLHQAAKSVRVPKQAIKEQDRFAAKVVTSFGISIETPLTSAAKIQALVAPILAFVTNLDRGKATEAKEPAERADLLAPLSTHPETITEIIHLEKTEQAEIAPTCKTVYLLPKNIESFVKTEQIMVGSITCQFNCLLDLGLAFHHSSGIKRLGIIMEVLFLGIPSRQEKGEIIREPISSRWNDITRALQELSQTLYTLKNTLDIENAQKIMTQIPTMLEAERIRLLSFTKAAYSFVSWYRSAFDFPLAQQAIWEKLEKELLNTPSGLSSKPEITHIEIKETPNKPTRSYRKKESTPKQEEPLAHVCIPEPIQMLSGGILTPTSKILSLRKII